LISFFLWQLKGGHISSLDVYTDYSNYGFTSLYRFSFSLETPLNAGEFIYLKLPIAIHSKLDSSLHPNLGVSLQKYIFFMTSQHHRHFYCRSDSRKLRCPEQLLFKAIYQSGTGSVLRFDCEVSPPWRQSAYLKVNYRRVLHKELQKKELNYL